MTQHYCVFNLIGYLHQIGRYNNPRVGAIIDVVINSPLSLTDEALVNQIFRNTSAHYNQWQNNHWLSVDDIKHVLDTIIKANRLLRGDSSITCSTFETYTDNNEILLTTLRLLDSTELVLNHFATIEDEQIWKINGCPKSGLVTHKAQLGDVDCGLRQYLIDCTALQVG